jgi:integrase
LDLLTASCVRSVRTVAVVLTRQEVRSIVGCLEGADWLMAMLLYSAGLRLMECLRLRVKDIDFTSNQIVVRAGKGDNDRHTMLPAAVKEPLCKHLNAIKRLHERYLERGLGRVSLPNALERKYPNAGKEWGWQWVFPAASHYTDKVTGERRRHHLHESVLQKAVKEAVRQAGITKPATPAHVSPFFCHALARRWLRYPNRPGVIGPQGRFDYYDLHARFKPRRKGCLQPP